MVKLFLGISLVLNIILGVLAYRASRSTDGVKGDYLVKQHGRFAIMTKQDTPEDSFIVAFDDGRYYWTIETNMLSLNIGLEQSFALILDKTRRRVERTVLEFGDSASGKTYVIDMNADGVPEKRRVGTRTEIFFGGGFYASKKHGENRVITKDDQEIEVSFDGQRWKAKNQP
jgi:hypothetical protein